MATSSKVRPAKVERYDNKSLLVRYNIVETEDSARGGVKYVYDEVIVHSLDKGVIIEAIMRTKYTQSEEIALAFGRKKDAKKLAEHEAFKESAAAWANEILAEV